MSKIVVLDGYTENPGDLSWEELEKLGEFTLYDRTEKEKEKIIERIGDCDIVITNKTPITKEIIDACPNIAFIAALSTGFNQIDVEYAKEKGIPVSNVPVYGTHSVSQYAIALLLEVCSRVGHHDNSVHDHHWENSKDFCYWDYPLIELHEKTMGIIGCGNIGSNTARIGKAFGMKVIAYSRNIKEEVKGFVESVSLDELFARSDVIMLHVPANAQTIGMINKESISKMKDGLILINNSRGQLVVEQDLADALNTGKVLAAAVDVVSTEPIQKGNPLLTAKNCIITPHISWAARESRQRIMDTTVANVKAFLVGKPINTVN